MVEGSIDTLAVESNITNKIISEVQHHKELIPTLPMVDEIPIIDKAFTEKDKEMIKQFQQSFQQKLLKPFFKPKNSVSYKHKEEK